MITLRFGILFFLLGSWACNPVNEVAEQAPFFDLKAYFADQNQSFDAIKHFRKSITLDGQNEEQQINQLDLEKELSLFTDSDINKTAWLDKYEVDSLFNAQGQLQQLKYEAKEEQLKTRNLSIHFSPSGEVDSLSILNASSSFVAQSEEHLTYIPRRGYRIENKQKVTAQSEHALTVDVKFVY